MKLRTAAALFALAAIMSAACGSSEPEARQATDTTVQVTVPPAGSQVPGATADSATAGPIAAAPGATAAPLSRFIPGRGPGVTDTTIKIGLVDQGNLSQLFASAFGNPKPEGFTDREKGDALLKYMNAHGGIAGRKIVPVWSHYDPNQESLEQDLATRCAAFTEDNTVFATAPFGIGWECYAKRKVVAIDGIISQFHRTEYEKASPYLYSVYAMTTDRVARMLAAGLSDAGFFKGGKTGLVYFNWPGWKAAVADLEAALKARGVTISLKEEINQYGDAATLGAASAAAANTVLKFASAGINRVLFFDATFLGPGMFMIQAENQDYHPRYGLHTGFSLDTAVSNPQPGLTPPIAQLKGSMGVGWSPVGDTGTRAKASEGRALCRQIMKDAHVYAGNDEPIGMCETLFFLKYALERGTEVSVSGLQESIESIGSAYGPRTVLGTFFGPKDHAGGAAYRTLAFKDACTCYEYTSGTKKAP